MAVIGIDIGGHSIKAGIVTEKGRIVEKTRILTEADKGREHIVNNIVGVTKELLKKDKTIDSIGIGVPGIVDKAGMIKYTPNIPLSNYNLGAELKKRLRKRVVFGNDADNFALAIHSFGEAKGQNNVVCLTLGTGVGSGLILNGQPYVSCGAPELGHTTIKYDAPKSSCCGNAGCLESFIGRKSFPEGPLEIYKKALKGDKNAIERYEQYGIHLGIGISNFVNIFNPDVIILGGEMSNAFDFFKKSMQLEIAKRSLFSANVIRTKVMDGGLIGAAILAF